MNAWIIIMRNVADGIEHDLYRGPALNAPIPVRRLRTLRTRTARGLMRIAGWIEPKRPCIDAAHGTK